MIILVPAYEPHSSLPHLVRELKLSNPHQHILVVDDGSGSSYSTVFAATRDAGATVIGYDENRGKGFALRHGLLWCLKNAPGESVVCADSDGQHTPDDIAAVAAMASTNPDALVLGVRAFSGKVPLRSKLGNWVSSQFVRLSTGLRTTDTQTGLRAYGPNRLREFLRIPGDRFEWEFNALIHAADNSWPIYQVPIETIYLNDNAGSHFRPLHDSARIYRPLMLFALSGLACWLLELVSFVCLARIMGVLAAVFVARLMSGIVNFAINKTRVFKDSSPSHSTQMVQYWLLAAGLVCATAAGVYLLSGLGFPSWLAKTTSDVLCFAVSFVVQRRWVFRRERSTIPEQRPALAHA